MSAFSGPAGRRFLIGLISSLVFVATGAVLYILGAPHYEVFFYLFVVYGGWVYLRFQRERLQPETFVPWYARKEKVAILFAVGLALIGTFAALKHSDSYQSDFFFAGLFLVLAGITQYRKRRTVRNPHETDNRS